MKNVTANLRTKIIQKYREENKNQFLYDNSNFHHHSLLVTKPDYYLIIIARSAITTGKTLETMSFPSPHHHLT